MPLRTWARLALLLVPLAQAVCAGELETRAGAGADVVKQKAMVALSLKAGPLLALAWESGNGGLGATYDIGQATGWRAELGGFYARRGDEDLGTRLNFLLRGGYCWRRLCAMYSRLSHGAGLGIERHRANSGLNFLMLELRFGEHD